MKRIGILFINKILLLVYKKGPSFSHNPQNLYILSFVHHVVVVVMGKTQTIQMQQRRVERIRWLMLDGQERGVQCTGHTSPCDYCHIKNMISYLSICPLYDFKTWRLIMKPYWPDGVYPVTGQSIFGNVSPTRKAKMITTTRKRKWPYDDDEEEDGVSAAKKNKE